jgi:hypothetical protein
VSPRPHRVAALKPARSIDQDRSNRFAIHQPMGELTAFNLHVLHFPNELVKLL